jgi:hypothetical protein
MNPLHRIAVEADDLRQHGRSEHRRAGLLLLENDLQQNGAGEVVAGLGIHDLEFLLVDHELLYVDQRDVGARLRVGGACP